MLKPTPANTIFAITLLTSFLVGSIACSRHSDDQRIAQDIQQKLAADPDTKDTNVTAASKDGKVTLNGKANAPIVRQKAEQIAKSEPGVSGVDDEIAADQTATPIGQATTNVPPPPVEKPEPPEPTVIPAGTVIIASLSQPLSSKTAQVGDRFSATLSRPIVIDGETVVRGGSPVTGKVIDAQAKGKIKGEARLELESISITIQGRPYSIQTGMQGLTEKGKGRRTAETTGAGAAGGALIGGLAGGGKGSGIGALLGAGIGLAGGAFTGNKQIELPTEAQLSFRLTAPLKLTLVAEGESNR